ncbi:polyhydroxyalkanoic acid system family protein [Casimicrobium huifangae]|uniref:polyhydroxyalkanoic acid system family protein n=1 Tax=Casimicrobium huifangae TaxID=2591109 RepID=UPI003784405A
MSHISIKRAHHSTVADARKTADKVRSGLHGTLAVSAKDIQVDVKLGLLMAAFKGPIQSAMETQLDGLIKPAPAAAKSAAAKPAGKAKK